MTFRDILGQDAATAFFRHARKAGRLAHAYLFTGPEGVGKRLTATAIAQALNCTVRRSPIDDACGECPACQLRAAGFAKWIEESRKEP